MASLFRLLAVGTTALAASLLLVAPSAAAEPDTAAAGRAAGYLVGQVADGDHLTSEFGDESITADAVLALAAAGRSEDTATIDALLGYLEGRTAQYATSPESAAKLTLVALATGRDPRSFGGTDLVSAVSAGVQPDGSFGAFPGPYASGLGMIALAGSGEPVPATMTDWLVSRAAPEGGWGYDQGQPADADSTAMAILGLRALPEPSETAAAAVEAAVAWAQATRQPDGSWAGFAPVNSTALLGSALQAAGLDQPEAVAYLAGLQLPDGGLPTGVAGATTPDLLATTQATLLLAGDSYLSLAQGPQQAPAGNPNAVWWWVLVAVLAAGVGVMARVQKS